MNMKYQRGRTSLFGVMGWSIFALWMFGAFDDESGSASVTAAIGNLTGVIIKVEKSIEGIQNERGRLNAAGAERLSKSSEATRRAAEAQSDNIPPVEEKKAVRIKRAPVVTSDIAVIEFLEPKYIPNKFRDKGKYIQLPLTSEYYPLRHSDGTLWGCKADKFDQTVCYPVSD